MIEIQNVLNTIIQDDCLNIMKQLPDKCIDLCLTDPPYNINLDMERAFRKDYISKTKRKNYTIKDWDKKQIDKIYFDEIFRISKNQIIFGANHFIEKINKNSSCWIVWDKNNGLNGFADCELAWTSFKSAVRLFKYTWKGMLQENMKNKEIRYHPTQKPVELFKWILQKYSEPNMLIFDPFAGSGTTVLACMETGRNYLCVEQDSEYIQIINDRLKFYNSHNKLF